MVAQEIQWDCIIIFFLHIAILNGHDQQFLIIGICLGLWNQSEMSFSGTRLRIQPFDIIWGAQNSSEVWYRHGNGFRIQHNLPNFGNSLSALKWLIQVDDILPNTTREREKKKHSLSPFDAHETCSTLYLSMNFFFLLLSCMHLNFKERFMRLNIKGSSTGIFNAVYLVFMHHRISAAGMPHTTSLKQLYLSILLYICMQLYIMFLYFSHKGQGAVYCMYVYAWEWTCTLFELWRWSGHA